MPVSLLLGLFAAVAAFLTGIGLLTTLVPLRASASGFDAETIGWIAGFYYLGFLAGPWVAGWLVGRLKASGAFTAAAALALAAALLMPLVPEPPAWAVLRFAQGMGFAILYILIETGLNASVGNASRGRLLSAYLIVCKAGLIGGQMLLVLTGSDGLLPFAVAAATVALAALLHAFSPLAGRVAHVRVHPAAMLRAPRLPMIGCLAYGVGESAFFALAALFARQRGLGVAEVSTFMSAFFLGGAVAQWPLGHLSDFIDRRKVILLGAATMIAAGLMLGVPARPTLPYLLAGGFMLGGAMLPMYALWVALANDEARPEERLHLSSGLTFAYAVGAVVGPPLIATLMEWTPRALPLSESLLYALVALLLVASLRGKPLPRPAG